MYSLTIEEIDYIIKSLNCTQEYPYFVETGTLVGETLNNVRTRFKKLRSVELLPQPYEMACQNKARNQWDNVELYLGDSVKLLPTMIDGLDGNIVFFLDGHRSGGEPDKVHKDVPLLEELTIIKEKRSHYNDLIIVDDFRLFGTVGCENWSEITVENIAKIMENKSCFEFNDRCVIANVTEV